MLPIEKNHISIIMLYSLFALVLDNIISMKQILSKQYDNDISKRQVFRLSTQEKVLKNDSEEKRREFLFLLGLYDCKK